MEKKGKPGRVVWPILFVTPVVLLYLVQCSLNPGEARRELRGWGKLQEAQELQRRFFSPGWHSSHSSRLALFSPLVAEPADTAMRQQDCHRFLGELAQAYGTKQPG